MQRFKVVSAAVSLQALKQSILANEVKQLRKLKGLPSCIVGERGRESTVCNSEPENLSNMRGIPIKGESIIPY